MCITGSISFSFTRSFIYTLRVPGVRIRFRGPKMLELTDVGMRKAYRMSFVISFVQKLKG